MMAIVVDQGDAATVLERDLAVALEAPADALEVRQRLDDGFVGHAHLVSHRDRRQGVQHVVHAGQVEHDVELRRGARPQHGELHLRALVADVHRADVGRLGQAVADDRLGDGGHDLAHVWIVFAEDGRAVERQMLQEVDEGLLEPAEVVAVGLHVVGVDVGHHGDHRLQVKE